MSSSIKQYYKGRLEMNYIANQSAMLFLAQTCILDMHSFINEFLNKLYKCADIYSQLSRNHLMRAILNSFKLQSIYLERACNFRMRYLPQPPSIYLQTALIWLKYLSKTCLVSSQLRTQLLYYCNADWYLLINEQILAYISTNPLSTSSMSNITFLPMQILLIFSSICSSTTFAYFLNSSSTSHSSSSGPYKARQDSSLMMMSLLKLLSSISRQSFQRQQYCMTLSLWARSTVCSCCCVFSLREAWRNWRCRRVVRKLQIQYQLCMDDLNQQ